MSRRKKDDSFIGLRHLAAGIEVGITERPKCPFCGGGETHEASFAITRTSPAEALYICHRAACGRSGRLAVWGFRLEQLEDNSTQAGKQFTPRLHTRDTAELGAEWASELLDLYGLRPEESSGVGWRVELESNRLVCPIRSPLGVVRGVELRRSKVQELGPYSCPKTESYRFLDEQWLGWYRTIKTGPTVLVEDAISALKVSRHFQVVCLIGSHLNEDMVMELVEVLGNQEIVLALDPDATAKALKFVVEWRFLLPNFRCVPLRKDLKYESDEEILARLKS